MTTPTIRPKEGTGMDAQELVERIMTQHWDIGACPCWVCKNGRDLGFRPRQPYLHDMAFEEVTTARPKDAPR